MKVKINDMEYAISVKEVYLNEHKQFVEETIPLDEWAEIVCKKAISTLFYLEDTLEEFTGYPVRLSEDYPELKKPILNLSGSVSRLPKNLIIEKVD